VTLQAKLRRLVRRREAQIGHGGMGGRHRGLRMARGAIDLRAIGEAGVATGASDGARHVDRLRAQRMDLARGDREQGVTETGGHPAGGMAAQAGSGVRSEPGDPRMARSDAIDRFPVTRRAVLSRKVLAEGLVRPRGRVAGQAAGKEMTRRRQQHEPLVVIGDAGHLRVCVAPDAKRGGIARRRRPGESSHQAVLRGRVLLCMTRSAVDRRVVEARRSDVAALAADASRQVHRGLSQRMRVGRGDREGGMSEARGHSAIGVATDAGRARRRQGRQIDAKCGVLGHRRVALL